MALLCTGLWGTPLSASAAPVQPPPAHGPKLTPPGWEEASKSPDWVPVPAGLAYKSCVHVIPNGSAVSDDGVVTVGGAVVERIPECPYSGIVSPPRSHAAQQALAQAASNGVKDHGASAGKGAMDLPYYDGWWIYSNWTSSAQITKLSATWTVPPNPSVSASQLIYLFPSVESVPGQAIVQPVLQWGYNQSFGGAYWLVAVWYVYNGNVLAANDPSSALSVTAGHSLSGSMSRPSGTSTAWTVSISDNTVGGSRTATFSTGYASWTLAQGGALEVKRVTACAQLPNTSSVKFNTITVATTAGTVAPTFTSVNNVIGVSGSPGPGVPLCYAGVTATSTATTLSWVAK